MLCKECGSEFTLRLGKPGFVNICPSCTDSPEARAKKIDLMEERELTAMGYEVVRRFRTAPLAEA